MERFDVDRAVTPDRVIAPASVVVEGGRVVAVGEPAEIGVIGGAPTRLHGTLVPGFVDLQVNGIAGRQFGHESGEGLDLLAETAAALVATGTTAFCPTITSRPLDDYPAAVAGLGTTQTAPRSLGLHLEGPFLSAAHAGAHDRASLIAPTPEAVERLLDLGDVAIVTLAPELPGGRDAVARIVAAGAVVSAGHTDATYEQLRDAVDAGVTMVTHVFNAQRGVHHRDPGTAGGALLLDDLHVGIILDGEHVHPDLALLALRAAGERAFAVTDAIATAGLPAGRHTFGDITVDTTDGPPRLLDGTLAGSNLTMDAAFRFVAERLGLPAAVMATATTPARAVGRRDLGVIEPGAAADLVLLDERLEVRGVWCDGARVV